MNHRHLPSLALCLGVLLTLGSCSSSKRNEETEGASVSGLNRFMDKGFDKKSGQFDRNIVSQFDERRFGADKKIKEGRFHAGSFTGKQDYKGATGYKAKEFSQSDKLSREGKEAFAGTGKEAREGDEKFASKDSRYESQRARQGDQEFSGDDKNFKTGEVRDAAKAQKKNTRPEIIPKDGDERDGDKPAYTEAEVKRLVNRN